MEQQFVLSEEQQKEYHTVMLAGLLHDVGKFFQEWFLEGNEALAWPGLDKWLNKEERQWLTQFWTQPGKDPLPSTSTHATRVLPKWEKIIREAVYLANRGFLAHQRYDGTPLQVLLQELKGDHNQPVMEQKNYAFNPLSVAHVMPFSGDKSKTRHAYEHHMNEFRKEFKTLLERFNTPSLVSLYYLFEKYLWCIPVSQDKDRAGISLFHQVKTTTAILAALFHYFTQNPQEKNHAAIERKDVKRFSLVQGDISGIQKFIYNISMKGASRSLKGRSFYLQLLTDAVAKYLLHQLGLTAANLIYCSGGKFYILAQPLHNDTINRIENEVNDFLFKKYGSIIYFALGKTDFDGKSLMENFAELWKDAGDNAEKHKHAKFKNLMEKDYDAFFGITGDYGVVELCSICGKEEKDMAVVDDKRKCQDCLEMEKIGTKLRNFKFLGEVIHNKNQNDVSFTFGNFSVSYAIYEDYPLNPAHNEIIYSINDTDFLNPGGRSVKDMAFRFYGGNVAPQKENNQIKEFDDLGNESQGINRLGILRMDVDNLGFLFKSGLPEKKRHMAAVSAMSFYFDMFFQGYINEVLTLKNNQLYVIYSGGDDLFLMGPWHIVVDISLEIHDWFKEYTANNPNITVSAGIELIKAAYPLSRGADMAGEAEDAAKSFRPEKDGICFLGKPLSWDNFEICRLLKNLIVEVAQINKSIINRLKQIYLLYKKNAEPFSKADLLTKEVQDKVFYNQWMWRMVYSLHRFAKDNPKLENSIEMLKIALTTNTIKNKKAAGDIISFLDIPARWAEFSLRNNNKED